MSFNESNNWQDKSENVAAAAVAAVSGGRVGIFGAKMYTTHRHKLEEAVGLTPKGAIVLTSVQSYHAQKPETLASARWVCSYPACRGRSWASKDELFAEHSEPGAAELRREAHCIMAISWLPEEFDTIAGVMMPSRGANAMTRITTVKAHGLAPGEQITILNVQGRHDAMAEAHESASLRAQVDMAKLYEELGDKKKAKEILDSISLSSFTKGEASTLVNLSVNGTHLAIPRTATSFDIAQELDGVFVAPSNKDAQQPRVMLRPRRPVLLSDVE